MAKWEYYHFIMSQKFVVLHKAKTAANFCKEFGTENKK